MAIWLLYRRYNDRKTSLSTFCIWVVLWIVLIIVGICPELTTTVSRFFGFSRGLGIELIAGIALLAYLIFKLYLKIGEQDKEITKLIRLIAINNEESLKEDED